MQEAETFFGCSENVREAEKCASSCNDAKAATEYCIAVNTERRVCRRGTCGDNCTSTLVGGTLSVAGTGEMYDYEWHYAVLTTPWEAFKDAIKSVVIEDGVTKVGANAFYGCANVTSVRLPVGVTTLGDAAFSWCTALEKLHIPDGVTRIGEGAFYECYSLRQVAIPAG